MKHILLYTLLGLCLVPLFIAPCEGTVDWPWNWWPPEVPDEAGKEVRSPAPCDDFYEWVCSQDPVQYDYYAAYLGDLLEAIYELLADDETLRMMPRFVHLVVWLFRECRQLYIDQNRPSEVYTCLRELDQDHFEVVLWIYVRWFSAQNQTIRSAGDITNFAEVTRAKMTTLIGRVRNEVRLMIHLSSSWMDDETQDRVDARLLSLRTQVGFPDYLLTHFGILDEVYQTGHGFHYRKVNFTEVVKTLLTGYYVDSRKKVRAYKLEGIAGLNPDGWDNEQQRAQYYEFMFWKDVRSADGSHYLHDKNLMFVPLYEMKPPIFSPTYPALVNFALLGFAVGHEMAHALDPLLESMAFFSDASFQSFQERANCLRDQYHTLDNDPKKPDHKVNGGGTVDENFADFIGISSAYYAMQKFLVEGQHEKWDPLLRFYSNPNPNNNNNSTTNETILGIHIPPDLTEHTSAQGFFVSFALRFCVLDRNRGGHKDDDKFGYAQPWHRVNQPLRNFESFALAFNCSADIPEHRMALSKAERCSLFF